MSSFFQVITDRHTHENEVDKNQLEAVLSSSPHLIVEAPAGYGKTKTMVSKIAYLIATREILYPKKIIALTFSINAAFKIRKEITEQLPIILSASPNFTHSSSYEVYSTNYHGLSRRILNRFGYLIHNELSKSEALKGVGIAINEDDEKTTKRLRQDLAMWEIKLADKEIKTLIQFTKSVYIAGQIDTRSSAVKYLLENTEEYLRIIKEYFLPKKTATFDSLLLFARQIFKEHPKIRSFYREFFPTIIVDEFQDTNILQWSLLQELAGRNNEETNSLYLFGDRCQKIYDFIGAMDGIIDLAKHQYSMKEIPLLTNHRFRNNPNLMQFDNNIRKTIQDLRSPLTTTNAPISVYQAVSQDDEAEKIFSLIKSISEKDPDCTIAILTRLGKKNKDILKIVNNLNSKKEQGFSYFYALYSDEDEEYVEFHKKCLHALNSHLDSYRSFKDLSRKILFHINPSASSDTEKSLQILLKTFFAQIVANFRFLNTDEQIELVADTLRNKALKQYLMYVTEAKVTLSTIHGSKGLEWDYIILPDMEKNSFPPIAICKSCHFSINCQINWDKLKPDDKFSKRFTQELNVFYVGGTRARKSVYFTGSSSGEYANKNNSSCLLRLTNLEIIQD